MSPTSYHAAPSRVIFTRLLFLFGAENRNRTDTVFNHRRILSPVRLPVPPPRPIFLALRVGLEPTAYRLTAGCSTIELPKTIGDDFSSLTGDNLLSQVVANQVPSAD